MTIEQEMPDEIWAYVDVEDDIWPADIWSESRRIGIGDKHRETKYIRADLVEHQVAAIRAWNTRAIQPPADKDGRDDKGALESIVDATKKYTGPMPTMIRQIAEGALSRQAEPCGWKAKELRSLHEDLQAIHISAFIDGEKMSAEDQKECRYFIYKTCISAAQFVEDMLALRKPQDEGGENEGI